jgi:hypothetical protein
VAEGSFLRFYTRQEHTYLASRRIFQAQAIHGIAVLSASDHYVTLVIWGGLLVRAFALSVREGTLLESTRFSNVVKATDWILDLSSEPVGQEHSVANEVRLCAAITAHNALLELTVRHVFSDDEDQR